jgi:hypothetical protein
VSFDLYQAAKRIVAYQLFELPKRRHIMFIGRKVALSAVLILGTASACLAQNGGLPKIDLEKMCRQNEKAVRSVIDINQGFYENCFADEQKARDQLVQEWANFPALAKTRCVQSNTFLPSYIEWLTCLEMTRDVIKMRKEQAASTSADSKAQAKSRCPVVEIGEDGSIKSVVACGLY